MELKSISEDYIKLLQEIRIYFKNSNNSLHKARNEIKVIDYKDKSLVVKAFKVPNLFNKIVYTFFRDTKAKKSYYNSLKIADFVPSAIGYIEFKKFGLLHDSYFVSEKFDYDFSIREVLLDEKFDDREAIFAKFSEFTFSLHEKGILHKDYSPGNILIKKKDNSYIFKIVDINRMVFKELDINERLKNFSQLWAKDSDLKIIVDAYLEFMTEDRESCLEFMTEDRESCLQKAIYYSKKHKDIKNFKKRLKGRKVVD